MPVVNIPTIRPLSSFHTVKALVSQIRVLIGRLDNKEIQDYNIRQHLNFATSHVAELLRLAKHPQYGVIWKIAIEGDNTNQIDTAVPHFNGMFWCDLSTLVVPTAATIASGDKEFQQPNHNNSNINAGIIPANALADITKITGSKSAEQSALTNVLLGHFKQVSIEEITTMYENNNDQYRFSICWAIHGSAIFIYYGEGVRDSTAEKPYVAPRTISLWAYRKPILDNLKGEHEVNSSWSQLVDIPDNFIELVLLKAQKKCHEQLNENVPPDLDTQIAQQTQAITQNLMSEIEFEKLRRLKEGHKVP